MEKKLILVSIMMLAAVMIMFGCEGEQGPPGQDAATVCTTCHNDDTEIWAIVAQWDNSVHKNGGNFERNTPPCSRCHTSEGFVAYLETGDPGTPEYPSAIGCFTCHEPHTNYNFDLRIMDPVTFDYEGTFDKGEANLCANCHQIRVPDPLIPQSGNVTITSSRWGPHHGPQATTLSGNGAYEFPGETYTKDHAHYTSTSSEGCPTCHMAAPFGAQAGGHTWNMTYFYHGAEEDFVTGCGSPGCHSSVDDFSYGGVQDSVVALLGSLETLLINGNILNPATGLLNVPSGGSITLTASEAGAYFNYVLFEEDRSEGIHNPPYVLDALNASITALGGR